MGPTSIAKKPYIFVIFLGGVSGPPVPPSVSAHVAGMAGLRISFNPYPLWSSLIWVHIVCNIVYLRTEAEGRTEEGGGGG